MGVGGFWGVGGEGVLVVVRGWGLVCVAECERLGVSKCHVFVLFLPSYSEVDIGLVKLP